MRLLTYVAAAAAMAALVWWQAEDRILGLVLRDLGVRGVFDRSIVGHHVHSRPLEAFLRDCYENGRGRDQ